MTTVRRLLACLTVTAFAVTFGALDAQDKKKDDKKSDKEKEATTKEIMKKVPGKTGLVSKISTAAKDAKWEDAQKIGKELKTAGDQMVKNKPKKGDQESWDKHTKGFSEVMTEIADAADKKDKDAVAAGVKKFGTSCGDCHKYHK